MDRVGQGVLRALVAVLGVFAAGCPQVLRDRVGETADASTCFDEAKNGAESDVDCGGSSCLPCADDKICSVASDCASSVCEASVCAAPACTDSVKNGSESGVDCGGPSCASCPDEGTCGVASDCASGVCQGNVCVASTCVDEVKNGGESDINCGGPCAPCGNDQDCGVASDCASGVCQGNVCVASTCVDEVKNGGESDADCGGPCAPCGNNQDCGVASDCASGVCQAGVCLAPTCFDMVKNGGEIHVDCGGGACPPCGNGMGCIQDTDCISGLCVNATCSPWSQTIGTPVNEYPHGAAVDDKGNLVVVGESEGTVVMGYPPDNTPGWSIVLGNGINNVANAVAVDSHDADHPAIAVVGSYVDTKPLPGCPALPANPGSGAFVAKLDAEGICQWEKGTTGISVYGEEVATDATGNIFVAGKSLAAFDFGVCHFDAPPANSSELFLMKVGPDGSCLGGRRFAGDATDGGFGPGEALGLAIDPVSGGVVVTGHFHGTVDFGNGPGNIRTAGPGATFFLLKLDPALQTSWVDTRGAGYNGGVGVVADGSGNIFVTGNFHMSTNFGCTLLEPKGDNDVFVARYDAGGGCIWSGSFGGLNEETSRSLALDEQGNVIVAGTFLSSALDFDSDGNVDMMNVSGGDAFLLKFSLDGAGQNAVPIAWRCLPLGYPSVAGNSHVDLALAVHQQTGNLTMAGSFDTPVNFGDGLKMPMGPPENPWDAFVASLGPLLGKTSCSP